MTRHRNSPDLKRMFLALLLCLSVPLPARASEIERLTVHGVSLEKNLIGDSADRRVSVYLPSSYARDKARRYPVLFLLHGFNDTDEEWTVPAAGKPFTGIQQILDEGIRSHRFGEMIVVMPDERTRLIGAWYMNSAASGDWDQFIARELTALIDKRYRTLASPANRAIAGHSMGGYGALRLAMLHPDVFGASYGISPALVSWTHEILPENPAWKDVIALQSTPPVADDQVYQWGFLSMSAAFSPDSARKPFYADFPFRPAGGSLAVDEPAFSRWESAFLANMAKDHAAGLSRLKGIAFDAGSDDEFRFIPEGCRRFSDRLTSLGIAHQYNEYNGDHRQRLWGKDGRLLNLILPWIWNHFDASQGSIPGPTHLG